MEIKENIHAIKEIVDNAMHVMIDEDEIFSFSKENKNKIEEIKTKNINLDKIISNLLKLNILKTDNPSAKNELEASAKLSIHLISEENQCDVNKIGTFLSQ